MLQDTNGPQLFLFSLSFLLLFFTFNFLHFYLLFIFISVVSIYLRFSRIDTADRNGVSL